MNPSDEAAWRLAVDTEMRLRGYSDQEIREASNHTCRDFGCEWDSNHSRWVCTDEEGNSAHPVADEYGDLVGVIGRALEAAYQVDAPLLGTRPQPTLDRDAFARAMRTIVANHPGRGQSISYLEIADELVKTDLFRPLPTREQIDALLEEHGVFEVLCESTERVEVRRRVLTAAIAALFSGGEE